ncbi:MAG: hypothetical protein IJS96_10800 [Schwartzia sp.]|nr:hypothetical protein [Schwartzia sp. (in: firmicutes)]
MNEKTLWVHYSSIPELTYQTDSQMRGQPGMEDNGVLTKFGGIAVRDCRASYRKYEGISLEVFS